MYTVHHSVMLRLAQRQGARLAVHRAPSLTHNFVSTVLLTRTWENESVAELRKEVKARGLSPYVPLVLYHNHANLGPKGKGIRPT